MTAAERAGRREALLGWYRGHRRDLPWRRTRDPYAIWVSEIMLQQTRVDTVVPYYERFLQLFPDVAALAAADEEQVLAAWSGLGYYRRARALHRGARVVMERHDGRLPDDPVALLELPGIGRYTAGAVASIAFDLCEPILDGNVRRVLSRWNALPGDPARPTAEDGRLWSEAAELAQGPSPGELNQALMELGATVCTPRTPRCDACPVAAPCAARATGHPEAYPAPRKQAATRRVRAGVAVVRRGSRLLLERPAGGNPLRGTWELPAMELEPGDGTVESLTEMMRSRHGVEVALEAAGASAVHGIMNRRLALEIHPARLLRGRTAGRDDLRWVELEALDEVAVSGATRKALRRLEAGLIR